MKGGEKMKKITKVYRHGEIGLVPVAELPKGLKKAETDVIMQGSGNNPHKVRNCEIYFKNVDQYIFGYLKANKGNALLHPQHGKYVKGKQLKECSLPEGVYELRRQVENTHEGLKPVID